MKKDLEKFSIPNKIDYIYIILKQLNKRLL